MKKLILACLLCFSGNVALSFAGDLPNQVLPVADDVRTGQLANGMRYYLRKNAKPEQRVELRLVVRAGSVHEDHDQRGLAHFLEHMAFNGSKHFPKNQLISYLQSIGIRFGADLNAYTSFNETVYILPVPTDKPENLEQALLVLKDWTSGLNLENDEIEKERHIVQEEARQRKGVQERLNKRIFPELFKGSRYAERMPIGDDKVIANFKPERLSQFYRDWYRPDLMAIIAVGDLDVDALEQKIRASFSEIKKPDTLRKAPDLQIPSRKETEVLVLNDSEATQRSLLIRYPLQAKTKIRGKRDLRQMLVRQIAATIVAERLNELTQQAQPPFNYADAAWGTASNDYESFNINVVFGRQSDEDAIKSVYQILLQASKSGIENAEYLRAKENISRWLEKMRAEKDKQVSATFVSSYMQNFLQDTPLLSIEQEYQLLSDVLSTIKPVEINQELAAYPVGQTKFLVFTGPQKTDKAEPGKRDLLNWIHKAEQQAVVARATKVIATQLMEVPNPGQIVKENYREKSGIYEWTLSNGLEVVLKPTQFKNDEILMQAQRYGGNLLAPEAQHKQSVMALSMVSAMGMGKHTPTDLSKLLAGSAASFSVGQSDYMEFVSGSAGLQDLEKLLQLQYLRFSQPRMDKALYAGLIQRAQDSVKDLAGNPDYIFTQTVNDVFWNYHPRRPQVLLAADYAALDPELSMKLYQQRFSSAHGLRFIFVGNLQPQQFKPLMLNYLASLPTPALQLEFADPGLRPVSGRLEKDIFAGKEDKARVTVMSEFAHPYSKHDALRLRALSDIVDLRINQVLREKLALVYSGDMSAGLNRLPYAHVSYQINLPCAPENTEKVKQALWSELENLRLAGPADAELDKVKQALLKRHQVRSKQNSYWLNYLTNTYFYNRDPDAENDYENRVQALSVEEIKSAAATMINDKQLTIFTLYPEHYKK